jgi:hypothetical protein
LRIHSPKSLTRLVHLGAVMESPVEMWRWTAGLQAATEILHRRCALDWHAPTARER